MKNFPNQSIDIARIRLTIEIIDDLNVRMEDARDDGVLGYALAQEGAYTFRGLDRTAPDADQRLADRIAAEQQKPRSSQGARTNAREMRRTLVALGWVDGAAAVTTQGRSLLDSAPGSQQERLLVAEALLQLAIPDQNGNTSHPVRIMLDLLSQAPSLHREGLELMLEAVDDSSAERDRVRRLYRLTPEQRAQELGVSDYQVKNARKIFPSLARAAGLVVEDAHGVWSVSPDGQATLNEPEGDPQTVLTRAARDRQQTRREVTADNVAQNMGGPPRRALDAEEQQRAAELLVERTGRHQRIVRALAGLIQEPGAIYEDRFSFDLLWVPADQAKPILLFEVKTLDADISEQCRRAVAQLGWYHFFDVSPTWPDRAVREIAVFDGAVELRYLQYLDSKDISALLVTQEGHMTPLTSLSEDLPDLLGHRSP